MSSRTLLLIARVAGWLIVPLYIAGACAYYLLTISAGFWDGDAVVDNETDLDALNYALVSVVRKTIQPSHVSLWLSHETPMKAKQEDQPTI